MWPPLSNKDSLLTSVFPWRTFPLHKTFFVVEKGFFTLLKCSSNQDKMVLFENWLTKMVLLKASLWRVKARYMVNNDLPWSISHTKLYIKWLQETCNIMHKLQGLLLWCFNRQFLSNLVSICFQRKYRRVSKWYTF